MSERGPRIQLTRVWTQRLVRMFEVVLWQVIGQTLTRVAALPKRCIEPGPSGKVHFAMDTHLA